MPEQETFKAKRKLAFLLLVLLLLIVLAVAWKWSPMGQWLRISSIVDELRMASQSFGPAVAIACFALALVFAVPLTFATLVMLVAFGSWTGAVYVMSGALIGAFISFGAGMFLGREVVLRLGGQRMNDISQRLARNGLLAVIAIRLVPIAPFAIINMVAGASLIRLRDMLLGTFLGMLPGTLVMAVFIDQIIQALEQPNPLTFVILALTAALIVTGAIALKKWLKPSKH